MRHLPVINEKYSGKIEQCPHQNCGFRCCEFNQNNYIVMYPGEVKLAKKKGKSLTHLTLTPYQGGYKAICKAKDTSCCDNGYKPLDCKSYPFFPQMSSRGVIQISLKGAKCPLVATHLKAHQLWVKEKWNKVVRANTKVGKWLSLIKLVGYEQL